MKRILIIARNELRNLYYSPVAWLSLVILMALTAFLYLNAVGSHVAYFERKGYVLQAISELTYKLVGSGGGYFHQLITDSLYIFFPLITMGLISREINDGTIRLLYSSPVRVSEIVLGKNLAMLGFIFAILLILSITLIGFSFSVTNPDYTLMAGSLGAVFLLLATYAAIGLFVSSLTSYQIVAAIITFVFFYLLVSVVPNFGTGQDIIRHISYYFNIRVRLPNLLGGLYNLRDIFYFLIIIGSFLAFTIIRMRLAMQSVSLWVKTGRYLAVIGIAFITGYITENPRVNGYVDLTRDQINTITPATQKALAQLDEGPLEIIMYNNLLSGAFIGPSGELSMIKGFWEKYIRFKPDIRVKIVHYYDTSPGSAYHRSYPDMTLDEIAEKHAKAYGLSLDRFLPPAEIRQMEDIEAEEYRTFFRLNYGDKSTVLRVFDDSQQWPSEREIVAAFSRLTGTPPRVAFLSGHIERSPFLRRDRDYTFLMTQLGQRFALINQGMDVDTLNLEHEEIPGDLAALVIADPRKPIADNELEKIRRYINSGGNLLVTAEPDRAEITKPILEMLGVSLKEGMLIQSSESQSGDYILSKVTNFAQHLNPEFNQSLLDRNEAYGDTLFGVALIGAGALEYVEQDGFRIEPLLTTDSLTSWNRTAPIVPDSLHLEVERRPDDQPGSFATGILMKRQLGNREQRIAVFSDADWISPQRPASTQDITYNLEFGFFVCFSQVTGGHLPVNILRIDTDDSFDITVQDVNKQRIVLLYIFPGLLALFGSIILIRRKRK